jgi:protein involved in polysaccharide export with SLBB domain
MNKNYLFKLCVYVFSLASCLTLYSQEELTPSQMKALKEISDSPVMSDDEKDYEEFLTFKENARREEDCAADECVFGYSLFSTVPLTYALSSDVPVPPSYTLGPGDQLKVEYYGNENLTKEGYITRTGILHLPLLGPITLGGLTFSEAETLISNKVKTELIGTNTFITLGELRSINIYVLGSAYRPGAYTISALTTLTNALFATGGVDLNGSLRNIEVKRNGKTIQSFDFYDLLLKGDTSKDMRLEQGDTIFIPLRKNFARLAGAVSRTGLYEFKEGETIRDLVNFGGKLNPYSRIELSRVNNSTGKRDLTLIDMNDPSEIEDNLKIDDFINIVKLDSINPKNIELRGEFMYPGTYGLNEGETILQIVERAGGLKESAYLPGTIFRRLLVAQQQKQAFLLTADELERSLVDAVSSGVTIDGEAYASLSTFIAQLRAIEPEGRQIIDMDLLKMKRDPKSNLVLQEGDILVVPSRSVSVNVVGEVLNSSSHLHKEGLSVFDYINLSGGMTRGADKNRIFVILPNGNAIPVNDKLFGKRMGGSKSTILPGSTIVVARNPDPFDAFKLVSILTPVLSDLAISAASIAAIND